MKTPAKWLHESLLAIFREAAESNLLRIDSRPVTVYGFMPDNAFQQAKRPMIVVERPKRVSDDPWGGDYVRHVYEVPIGIIDGFGVKPGDEQDVAERTELLFERMKGAMQLAANENLRLPWLGVFRSLCTWDENDPEIFGNNLMGKAMQLTVPMILERGKIYEVEGED